VRWNSLTSKKYKEGQRRSRGGTRYLVGEKLNGYFWGKNEAQEKAESSAASQKRAQQKVPRGPGTHGTKNNN